MPSSWWKSRPPETGTFLRYRGCLAGHPLFLGRGRDLCGWRGAGKPGLSRLRSPAIINAFDDQGEIHILQIEAHLDFVDERRGVRHGHGNPMRRAPERPYVTGLTQVGIRSVGSAAREGYADARAMGSDNLSVRQARALGPKAVIARIPEGADLCDARHRRVLPRHRAGHRNAQPWRMPV